MDTPKVSVIVSTFNRADLLKRCLSSIANQSFRDFEVIVVDDCSTDGTKQLLKEWVKNDPRFRVFHLDENHGSDSYPKNFGIKEAKGEFIAFMDDDDMYRVDGLKILYRYLSTGPDLVYGDYLIHDKKRLNPGWSMDFNPATLSRMNFIAMPTVMVKKSVLLEVGGFDETIPKFKDWNLWIRIQKRGFNLTHIPIITTEVFPQEESISNKFKVDTDGEGHYLPTYFNPADCPIYSAKTLLGPEKPLKVAIFTMTMDRFEYTKQMYSSLCLAGYPFDWFVVDNASKDETVEWVKGLAKKVRIAENLENAGVAGGWNQAIEFIKASGKYDIVIKIDNDCEMMSLDWLKMMVELFRRNRKMVLSAYVEGLEDSPGGVLRSRGGGKEPYMLINDKVLGLVPNLGGICFASPIELYENFRFEASQQFISGNKDYILSQYARANGYTLFYVEELRCWHIDGTKGQHAKYPAYFERHYQLQQEKAK